MREQVELLKHHADFLPYLVNGLHIVGEFNTVNNEPTLLMFFQAIDAADQRRFARTRRAADHDALALGHREVDVAQHMEIVAVPFVDLVEDDDGFSHGFCGARQCSLPLLTCFSTHRL
jgi:hypothetical protein